MKKALFFALCWVVFARENPFLPVPSLPKPSEAEPESEFSKLAFSFPKDARKIEQVKLLYLAADGSQKEYIIDVFQPVDWHKIYMLLSENELLKRASASEKSFFELEHRPQPKRLSILPSLEAPQLKAPAEEGAKVQDEIHDEIANANELAFATGAPQKETIKINKKLTFEIERKLIKIHTKSKLLREFSLERPNRIVLDFEGSVLSKPRTFALVEGSFDTLVIGVHKGFFRVVLHTDSKYDYDIHYNEAGYELKLK